MTERTPIIYTVGHSDQPLDAFVSLLRSYEIETLVDVRSAPYSRYVPHFSKRPLETAVRAAGISYAYLGQTLGGRPRDSELYDGQGRVSYSRIAVTFDFKTGIDHLVTMSAGRRLALMCSEEDPFKCHRRNLITPALLQRGYTVLHIRHNRGLDRAKD